jgi:hypothetical protein
MVPSDGVRAYFVYIRGRRNLTLSISGIRLQFDPDMEPDRKERPSLDQIPVPR